MENIKMNKNQESLLEFIKYCFEHPQERFWQALRNWSQYYFIFGWRPKKPLRMKEDGNHYVEGIEEMEKMGLEDTFYWE